MFARRMAADFDQKWNLHSHIHVISTRTSLPIGTWTLSCIFARPSSSQAQQSRAAPCHAPHLTLTRIQSCSALLLRDIFTVFVHGLDIADINTLVKSIWQDSPELCLAWQYDMSSGDSVSVYSEQSLGFIKDASNTSSAVYSLTAPIIAMSGRGIECQSFFSWELNTL